MAEIGATLNEARLRRKLDLMRVEADTKIRARYLRALEEEEWELLPGPTYVKTFLRTYGEYLGLDAKLLVEEYKQRYERPTPQELTPFSTSLGSRRERRRARGPIISPGVIVAVCFVALVGALAAIGVFWGDPSDDPAGGAGGGSASGRERAAAERRAAAAQDDAERSSRRRRSPSPGASSRRRTVRLRIVPEGEVYVCLTSRTGRALIDGQTISSRSRRFVGRRFRVTLGNGNVRLQVGSRSYAVPESDAPLAYDIRPRARPRRLASDAGPQCT